MKEIKLREKQEEQIAKEKKATNAAAFEKTKLIYKLETSHKTKLTKETVASDLKHFGKVVDVQLHLNGRKALVQFAYNDSVLRAINSTGSLAGCTLRKATDKDVSKFKQAE